MQDQSEEKRGEKTKAEHVADTADLVGEAARRLPEAARAVDRVHEVWTQLLSPITPRWKKILVLAELARLVLFARRERKKAEPQAVEPSGNTG
jgi:hypothetical protein